MIRPNVSAPPGHVPAVIPDRRRLLWAAITGSGMLSGIYWTFPPIFADADATAARVVATQDLMRTAALSGGDLTATRELPDIPKTPSIEAHRRSIALLEEGARQLQNLSGYTAEFSKKEVVGGVMTEAQTMRLKLRHEPFSVYMKWTDGKPGQELLYVDGQNDGSMIVRPSGLKGRLLGAIKLDPTGHMALSESRHPVTEVGLLRLSEIILESRYREAGWLDGYSCTESDATVDGRPCHRFSIVYDSPDVRRDYRKSVIYIDREYLFVSRIENYGWPAEELPRDQLDSETLIEAYSYTNVDLDTRLATIDFTTANAEYGLRRR